MDTYVPKKREIKIPKIPFGCLIPVSIAAMTCQLFVCFASISGIVNPGTPTPTIDVAAVQATALAEAWSIYTQTAAAIPTNTPLPTPTLAPTETPLPTQTATPIPTNTPFLTATLPPNCLAAYPRFCIEPGVRKSCEQLPSNFPVLPPDPFGYDGDGDGLGCEN